MNQDALLKELNQHFNQTKEKARRIFHGRGKGFDGLEHLNIEWYPPHIFVQNFADSLDSETTRTLTEFYESHPEIESVLLQIREWPEMKTRVICGNNNLELPLTQWTELDRDTQCEITLGKNRNTGAFLDMRAGWQWIKENSKDKRVLNLFCYTGVFSLFALQGEAARVDNIDMAANVLKIAQRNHQQNNFNEGNAAFFKRNILKSTRWLKERPKYDIIILDPPPYQKKAFRGWNDYQKLLKESKECLNESGVLFTCLNTPQTTLTEFVDNLTALFPEAKSIESLEIAPEIVEANPEKGLKTVIVRF